MGHDRPGAIGMPHAGRMGVRNPTKNHRRGGGGTTLVEAKETEKGGKRKSNLPDKVRWKLKMGTEDLGSNCTISPRLEGKNDKK